MLICKHRRLARRAVAAVELALVAPLFATIFVGMFELSHGLMAKETLSNAARKACRTAIQRDKASMDAFTDAKNIMTDNGYDSTKFNPQAPDGSTTGTIIGAINIGVTDPSGISLSDALNAPQGSSVSVQVVIPGSSVAWVTSFYLQAAMLESEMVVMMKQ